MSEKTEYYLPTWEKQDFIDWYGEEKGNQIWEKNNNINEIKELKAKVKSLETRLHELEEAVWTCTSSAAISHVSYRHYKKLNLFFYLCEKLSNHH